MHSKYKLSYPGFAQADRLILLREGWEYRLVTLLFGMLPVWDTLTLVVWNADNAKVTEKESGKGKCGSKTKHHKIMRG